jgi:hypothetical protein
MTTMGVDLQRGEHEVTLAWRMFAATFVALILSGIWSLVVGTASPGGDESDLVQGWAGVARNLPGYLLLVVVASLAVTFAVRAGMHGCARHRPALIAASLVLLFALSSVTRDASEVVMTTRAATMSWITFGIDAVVVAVIYLSARRQIASRRRSSGIQKA